MTDAENPSDPRFGIGGNKPPLAELLADANKALLGEVADVVAAAAEIKVESDAADASAAGIGFDLIKLRRAIEARYKADKEPYLRGGQTVDVFFRAPLAGIAAALDKLEKKVGTYKAAKAAAESARQEKIAAEARAESERLAAVAAERRSEGQVTAVEDIVARGMARRADDALAAAAAPPTRAVDKVTGAHSTAKPVWTFAIENPALIPLEQLRAYLDADAIEAAIHDYVAAGGRSLAGVRIFETTTVKFGKGKRS